MHVAVLHACKSCNEPCASGVQAVSLAVALQPLFHDSLRIFHRQTAAERAERPPSPDISSGIINWMQGDIEMNGTGPLASVC